MVKKTMTITPTIADKKKRKRDNTSLERRKQRKALLEQVPPVDENGIAYTKLQKRRMAKRLQKGLTPIPTPEEAAELKKQEAELKQKEEEELAGMLYRRQDKGGKKGTTEDHDFDEENEDNDDEEVAQENDEEDNDNEIEDENNEDQYDEHVLEAATHISRPSTKDDVAQSTLSEDQSRNKKRKRLKPVPKDYICQACQNKCQPLHWIYDCPDKVTVRVANQVSKHDKGLHDPDNKKVFVSGLPFDAKRKDVERMFQLCGKLLHCKLLTFTDTGRCKGQAFLSFATEEAAKKALALNGTTIENAAGDQKKKENHGRKELKLKVSKMLNRSATKQGRR
jgi:hypothetical protein